MTEYKIKRLKRGWIGKKTKLTVTSPFGVVRRLDIYNHRPKRHNGIDIGIHQGTPIYSPVTGKAIVKVQKNSRGKTYGGGLYIAIKSGEYLYYFMHLHKTVISNNSFVREGQLIAYSGGAKGDPNAGSSKGPHLHFEVRHAPYKNGKDAINPIYFLSDELTGRVKQNKMNQEIITISLISDTKTKKEKDKCVTVSAEQLYKEANTDVSDEVDDSATEEEEVTVVDTEYQEGLAAGIWQIVKLVMDTDVANIRLRDAATSIQQGSLQTFFNKVCQKPFVEFSGDTFGDQYCFLVRKPPFDRDGMLKTMVAQGLFENYNEQKITGVKYNEKKAKQKQWWNAFEITTKTDSGVRSLREKDSPYVIYEDDMISSNLSFNTQGIYSWYQFFPIYEMGAQEDLQYLIPAILFPEYAAIWGSRDLKIRSQYRNFINPSLYDDKKNGKSNEQGDSEVRHSIKDLKYIIESNAYAPFVRNGTIQILGNRRIKRGTFIRIYWKSMESAEIFYVESVSHNYSVSENSVSRTTTLTLSHGMIESFMFDENNNVKGLNENGQEISKNFNASYFNLINFGDYEKIKDRLDMDKWSQVISSWKVNIDVFLFFLRKLQFLGEITSDFADVKQNVNTFKNSKK